MEHLPETDAWDEITEEELLEAREGFRNLWDDVEGLVSHLNESSLESNFIRPVFDELGIPFEVEQTVQQSRRRPDYGFFESQNAIEEAFDHANDGGDFYRNAIAVADAKRWDRPLDTRGAKQEDYQNPSYQIDQYLRQTETTWAVLTNGRHWRLYYKPTSHRLDSYYEVDLPEILENGSLDDFKYFYLFFRHEAFVPDTTGDCFLDDVHGESNTFAQALGEDLRDNIYEAIKVLAEGFLHYSDNDLDEDDLSLVHDSSLIYLYRLIFVLYAEAEGRELLDTDNDFYEDRYSLNALKQEVAADLDSADTHFPGWDDELWSRINKLFELIDEGSRAQNIPEDELHVPAYNGGLFRTDPMQTDDPESVFLAKNQVGDAHLAKVIDLLTRSQNGANGDKTFVDYSSLDIRHLGGIYEGLLEYQLNIAEEPLTVEDGQYTTAEEDDTIEVAEGDVYLTTDSGERKATGSYYTPEYVVEYIVENTLGPLVDDIREDLVGSESYKEGGFAVEFANRVFQLKILDPAMGSGHFLTSAVNYLAREIIQAQERQAEQQGIETVNEDWDIYWARRQVAQKCIYGVDVNPLAVELSKVSLWLRTLAAEQPLAFLDHHLKTGNSLVGSDIDDVLTVDESSPDGHQLTLQESFDQTRRKALKHVTDRFEELLAIDNETLGDIKEMENVYSDVQDDPLYQKLLAMANVHTASKFGVDVPDNAYTDMAEALRDDSWDEKVEEEWDDWFPEAQNTANQNRFFHWELEFPIAFYDQDGNRKGDAGFDVVLGNPPYLAFQVGTETSRKYFSDNYRTAHRNYDVYVLFVEKGINLLKNEDGWFSYIIPNKFITSQYGNELKEFIPEQTQVESLIDFGDGDVFEDATNYVCIPILRTGENAGPTRYMENSNPQEAIQSASRGNDWAEIPVDAMKNWNLLNNDVYQVLSKIEEYPKLVSLTETIFEGARPGGEKIYYDIEDEDIEDELLKPFIKAEDIDPYHITNDGKQIIFPYRKTGTGYELLPISDFPNARKYLEEQESNIYGKTGTGSDIEYGYYHVPKHLEDEDLILCPDISKQSEFSIHREDTPVFPNTVYAIKPDTIPETLEYLVAVLNSSLLEAKLKSMSPSVRGGYYRYKTEYLEQLPIKRIDVDTESGLPEDIIENYLDGSITVSEIIESLETDKHAHDLLTDLASRRSEYTANHSSIDISLLNYLGNYADGSKLPDFGLFQPSDSNILDSTTDEYEKLRIGKVKTESENDQVTIYASARYKPENVDNYETDRWGYTETNYNKAFTLTNLNDIEVTLVEEFVPIAASEGDGFANYRGNATKTKSPIDRLKELELPELDDISDDLRRYLEVKESADGLETSIQKIDQLINETVYDLYGLSDREIKVLESMEESD